MKPCPRSGTIFEKSLDKWLDSIDQLETDPPTPAKQKAFVPCTYYRIYPSDPVFGRPGLNHNENINALNDYMAQPEQQKWFHDDCARQTNDERTTRRVEPHTYIPKSSGTNYKWAWEGTEHLSHMQKMQHMQQQNMYYMQQLQKQQMHHMQQQMQQIQQQMQLIQNKMQLHYKIRCSGTTK